MIGDDDRLPTRDGTPSGKANERQMIERGGMSVNGFRTDIRDNLDGTTTMLRTRGGAPEFSTLPAKKKEIAIAVARGFVAYAPGNSYAALFDPYTLAIENNRFHLMSFTYHVSDVADTPYLPRKWFDVWAWDKADVRINGQIAKSFFPFRFPEVQKAIPFLVPWPTPPIYGDKYRNGNLPKRMFAVGPTAVGLVTDPKWNVADVPIAVLSPKTPRDERKALVCGQSIDRQNTTAYLAQLYFTGQTWDALDSSWLFSSTNVAMLLSPPFLQATSSGATTTELLRPALASEGTSSGQMSVPQTLPSTEVAMVATGRASTTISYTSHPGGNNGYYTAVYDWSGTESRPLSGAVESTFSRESYRGSQGAEIQAGDIPLMYSATNYKRYDVRQEVTVVSAQTVPLFEMDGSGVSNWNGSDMTGDADNLYWGQDYSIPPTGGLNASGPGPNRGTDTKTVSREQISGTSVTRTYEEQTGQFSVKVGSVSVVSVMFSREKSFGPKPQISPRASTMYASILAQPPSNWYNSIGIGRFNRPVVFQAYVSPSSDLTWIRRYHGTYIPAFDWYEQPPDAVAEINDKFANMRDQFAAQTVYDSENSDGLTYRPGDPYYTATVNPDVTLDNRTLVWETRDYILFDAANEVRIAVEGNFSATGAYGASAQGTLSVIVRIESPWGGATKMIYERTAAYADMLPEDEIGSTGRFAIPSPRVIALFTPAHREQGTFRGAAYITKDEVSNGAVPAILVNFVLSLETYSFVGADEPNDHIVHFVPCNLIEMLYAFVFSRKYGIDPDERYPVSDTFAFSTIMAGLFGTQSNIKFRDGQMAEWLIGLGLPYFGNLKTELYRV